MDSLHPPENLAPSAEHDSPPALGTWRNRYVTGEDGEDLLSELLLRLVITLPSR